ncbi:fatty acyl-AMP ligase [Streptomyces sp. TRM 70351]|uniref:fatty acyl-AMP ligase n=1 Tax=Streptomyces sp. TRM 70351 TaxID=3116552 RepID=UPI002E7C3112|nr:fatty acyl-AMP ligase [Streptomyces sp. TRM 70351]MEE1930236.1 fatty acyl-AMP ligase [Streptomyces sp. TRM 70351]
MSIGEHRMVTPTATSTARSRVPAQTTAPSTLDGCLRHWAAARPDAPALTFVDFTRSARGTATTWTFARLEERTEAVAAWLRERVRPGERVAVLAPQGTGYVVGFLAAQRAGAIAVPLFPPGQSGHGDRLAATLPDCAPAAVLTTGAHLDAVHALLDALVPAPPLSTVPESPVAEPAAPRSTVPGPVTPAGRPHVVDVDALEGALDASGAPVPQVPGHGAVPQDIAYLQYSSGSTRSPAGAMISHSNVLANARQVQAAYGCGPGDDAVMVSWLPLFHDMGLMLGVATPLVAGLHAVLMDPAAFLGRPARWLRMLSTYPRAVTAAPNFAYDFAAARVSREERDWLRLDSVKALINGAEPVQAGTIGRFHAAFAECGLRPEAHRPSYGLAEATVLVSASRAGAPPRTTAFDRDALAEGTAKPPATPSASVTTLVSCGTAVDQELRVVDPQSCVPLPDGTVGELWLRGPNVSRGYWNADEEGRRTFSGTLPADAPGDGRWLRTGDLGVVHGGEVYVTGRMKDLVIVGGRNHYPQDIELTAEEAHPSVRPHHVAAFSVAADDAAPPHAAGQPEGDAGERLVVLAERTRQAVEDRTEDASEVAAAIRTAVSARHGVAVHDVVLLRPGQVPRTSSGKVARAAARTGYLGGAFGSGAVR